MNTAPGSAASCSQSHTADSSSDYSHHAPVSTPSRHTTQAGINSDASAQLADASPSTDVTGRVVPISIALPAHLQDPPIDDMSGSPHFPKIDYTQAEHGSDVEEDDAHDAVDITKRPEKKRAISSSKQQQGTSTSSKKPVNDEDSLTSPTDHEEDDELPMDDLSQIGSSLKKAGRRDTDHEDTGDEDDNTASRKASVSLQLFKEAAKAAALAARAKSSLRSSAHASCKCSHASEPKIALSTDTPSQLMLYPY